MALENTQYVKYEFLNALMGLEVKARIDADKANKAAIEQNTTDISAINTRVTTAEGKITTLIGDDASKSVRTIANEEIAAQLIPQSAQESLDTLQEIAAWIQAHPGDAATMNSAITTLGTRADGVDAILAGIGGEGEKATVKAYVDDAITAANGDISALETRMDTAEADIDAVEAILGGFGTAADAVDTTVKGYVDAEVKKVADDLAALKTEVETCADPADAATMFAALVAAAEASAA